MVLFRKPDELSEDGGDWAAVSLYETDGEDSSPASFEFSTAAASQTCAAGDVILGGKLRPFGASPPPRPKKEKTHELDRRRSRSLGYRPRRSPLGGEVIAEYRKLRRGVSESGQEPRRPQPRWYVLAFGSVRVPAEMELREIRIRQQRSAPPPPPPPQREWGPWKLLQSLSCKGMEPAAVAA